MVLATVYLLRVLMVDNGLNSNATGRRGIKNNTSNSIPFCEKGFECFCITACKVLITVVTLSVLFSYMLISNFIPYSKKVQLMVQHNHILT